MSLFKPNTSANVKTTCRFRLGTAAVACVLWGGWGWWVSSRDIDGLANAPWGAAVTQGMCSFAITLVMVRLVTWIFHRVPRTAQLLLPAVITVLITGSGLCIAHLLAGTANVLRTVLPPISVAFLFNVFIAIRLRRDTTDH